jgi:sugar phosphate isomerase/epimerase
MEIRICSYSFHRLLDASPPTERVFRYISDSRELGCTQLDLWNEHLPPLLADTSRAASDITPGYAQLSTTQLNSLARIKAAADQAGLPFGCLVVDGAHLYEPEPDARRANRIKAYRWLNIAERLGARQIRIDSGGSPEMPEAMFEIIVSGYDDLIPRAGEKGLELLMENHWGASRVPENVMRIMQAAQGLGLLFDTGNWPEGRHEIGWALCAKYARATHLKTFAFDAEGNEATVDLPQAIRYLLEANYTGCWGIESSPHDGDEYGAARKSMALIRRLVADKASASS